MTPAEARAALSAAGRSIADLERLAIELGETGNPRTVQSNIRRALRHDQTQLTWWMALIVRLVTAR